MIEAAVVLVMAPAKMMLLAPVLIMTVVMHLVQGLALMKKVVMMPLIIQIRRKREVKRTMQWMVMKKNH